MINFWEEVFNHDTYQKGAVYSASDFTNPPLVVKLKKMYPDVDDVATKDKVGAWVGNAIHSRAEEAILALYGKESTKVMSEVRMKFRSLSGTADIIHFDDDNVATIADIKTGKEANIKKKLKDPSDWVKQLSIYRYLALRDKRLDIDEVSVEAEIYWYTTDTQKYGIATIELYDTHTTIKMIEEFFSSQTTSIDSEPMCADCTHWRYRWCGVRSVCPHWGLRADSNVEGGVDEW